MKRTEFQNGSSSNVLPASSFAEVGFTEAGFQKWCKLRYDFEILRKNLAMTNDYAVLALRDSTQINAFSRPFSVGKSGSIIELPAGAFEYFDEVELRGICAHELSHIKLRHSFRQANFIFFQNCFSVFMPILLFLILGIFVNPNIENQIIELSTIPFATVIGWQYYCSMMRQVEREADLSAAELVGRQEYLTLLARMNLLYSSAGLLQRWFLIPLFGHFGTHPSIQERIKLVKSLPQ